MRFVFSEHIDEVRLAIERPEGLAIPAVRAFSPGQQLPSNLPPRAYGSVGAVRLLRRALQSAATDLLTALFPTDCLLCAGPITTLAPERVCRACIDAVRSQSEGLCSRCGEALGMESARFAASLRMTECTACRLATPAFARAVSYGAFEDGLRELLHLLKFGGQRALADRVLGPWLSAAMLRAIEGYGAEFIVVAVPMFQPREKERGFNQAQLLAASALRALRKNRPDLRFTLHKALERRRDTPALFALTPHQRRRSLKGAFVVSEPALLRGRTVLLVDDIMTTGATARECARALMTAGAQAVLVATVARAQPEDIRSVATWTSAPAWTASSGSDGLLAYQQAGLQAGIMDRASASRFVGGDEHNKRNAGSHNT